MVLVGTFALLGKVVSAAKEIAVAWRFGVSAEVDAYLLVLNLINLPVSIWASVLSVILLPMAAKLQRESPEGLRHFRAELLGATLVAGGLIGVVAQVALPHLLASTWLGLPPRTRSLAIQMVPVLGWLVLPGLLVGLYSVWMMSAGSHLNTLLEGMPALGILLAVLASGGIEPLIWGTLVGTVVQLGCLAVAARQRNRADAPAFSLTSPQWAPFWQALSIMLLGQVILSLTTVVDQFFAAGLGEGAISSMGYANRILALILGVVAIALTRATLPVFSHSGAEETARVRGLARRWAGLMWLSGVAVVAVGWLAAPWGVKLLFERGTFTSGNTEVVSSLFRLGLLQLPFYFASLVLVSLLASVGRYGLLFVSGVVGLSVKVLASYLLIPRLGVGALMLSNALVYAANLLLMANGITR
jgi:putative peptidoglycan lipid II flippase